MTALPKTEHIKLERQGPLLRLWLNRPGMRNAFSAQMTSEILETFQAIEADRSIRVVLLRGAGGTFCAGADLTAFDDPARRNEVTQAGGGAGPMGPTRMVLRKPLIAAISGHAVAGGLELALLADLRVVESDAVLGVFCRRWGVPLIDGGTARLPRIIGLGRAREVALTGRPVDAQEALAIGLANRVVNPGEAVQAAQALAAQIAAFPFNCLLTDRSSTGAGLDLPLAEALRAEGAAGAPIVTSEGAASAARFVAGQGRHGASPPGAHRPDGERN